MGEGFGRVVLFEGVGGGGGEVSGGAGVDVEGDAVVGDGVFAGGEEGEVGDGFGGAFGEFPEAFAAGAGFLGEEEGAVGLLDEEDVLGDGEGVALGLFDGEGLGATGLAEGAEGAGGAVGRAEGAVGLAEFHEGGVELAGVVRVEEGGGAGPEEGLSLGGVDGGGVVEESGEDAGDVGIDDGDGEAEGEGGHRAGGVGAKAGEGGEGGGVGGEAAVVQFEDGPGGFLEVADAVVVAEALPGLEEFGFGGGGEGGEVGEGGEEALKAAVLSDSRDGGLLEHDLGDEDGVGIGGAAPGVVLAVGLKPAEEGAAEGAGVAAGVFGGGWFQREERIEH